MEDNVVGMKMGGNGRKKQDGEEKYRQGGGRQDLVVE